MTGQEISGVTSEVVKNVTAFKALLTACDILLEELQKLGKGIDQAIDISESRMNNTMLLNSVLQAEQVATDVEVSRQGKPQNGLEVLIFISFCTVLLVLFGHYTI